ncbi:MAG: hypothetical protein V4490_03970, partial [Pseudomonadota bacterium]
MRNVLVLLATLLVCGCASEKQPQMITDMDYPDPATLVAYSDDESERATVVEGNYLAGEYYYQLGTDESAAQAAIYYLKAAEQGHQKAQARLGQLLISGKGLKHNPVE